MIATRIPVYVITGFLDSGKTSLINQLVSGSIWPFTGALIVQFETGEQALCENAGDTLAFTRGELSSGPAAIAGEIRKRLDKKPARCVIVEWNGVAPLPELQKLLQSPALNALCSIDRIIHVADARTVRGLLGRTGGALPEQLAGSDLAVIRSAGSEKELRELKKLFRSLNPGIRVFALEDLPALGYAVSRKRPNPVNLFCLAVLYAAALFFIVSRIVDVKSTPVNTLINVFLGIILQAIPFLLIGILISSAIQIFISSDAFERRFPRNKWLGMLAAVLFGFCLPVCDCASVPIFRSLIRKGVPLPAAVTFLMAAPVINPVVMLSTYYAFSGNLRVVAVRIALGVFCSLIIGYLFMLWPPKGAILSDGYDGALCSCGCYAGAASATGLKGKIGLYIRHSQAEFFNVGKYLMIGAFISALFQTIGMRALSVQGGTAYALSLLVMMLLAFALSLCSSSDAVVARSFSSSLGTGAVMGFLVFGPMMDIKNLIMLSGGFSRKFAGKLLVFTFAVCYYAVFMLARPLLGAR